MPYSIENLVLQTPITKINHHCIFNRKLLITIFHWVKGSGEEEEEEEDIFLVQIQCQSFFFIFWKNFYSIGSKSFFWVIARGKPRAIRHLSNLRLPLHAPGSKRKGISLRALHRIEEKSVYYMQNDGRKSEKKKTWKIKKIK